MFKSLTSAMRRLLARKRPQPPAPEAYEQLGAAWVAAYQGRRTKAVVFPEPLSEAQIDEMRAQVVVKVFAVPHNHAVRVKDFEPISAERIAHIRETFERSLHGGSLVPFKREGIE
ncbi:hypothetical protein GGR77_001538 [Xanthomonas translucens]